MIVERRDLLSRLAASLAAGALTLWAAGCAGTHPPGKEPASPAASRSMVVAANPHAARAGMEILAEGGSAVDAAIAVQMMLTLVEPQSSGIGGGAFLLHWDAENRRLRAYDGRETAPAGATEDLFLGEDGEPLSFWNAVVGGRSVGVPGVLRLLELAHDNHGLLPWPQLLRPAIALAEEGFPVSPRLHQMIAEDPFLRRQAAARRYFYRENGQPRRQGEILQNPELARTLRLLAQEGADAFYEGPLAEALVEAVRGFEENPGRLTLKDLTGYRALERPPLCRPYRRWKVCGMPPPTSGGVAVIEILNLLQGFDLVEASEIERVHLFTQAGRLAYADRNRYLADPAFVSVPVQALLDPEYLDSRAALIDRQRDMGEAKAGRVGNGGDWSDGGALDLPSTSHICVVDSRGNAVTMTTSVESPFGSRLWVEGFLLNNQLTDFSFLPEREGAPVANRVQPGKRPRSSMAPTAVFDREGKQLELLIGSPGGSRIPAYVAEALIRILDLGMGVQAAVSAPHALNRNGPTELEEGTPIALLRDALERRGHSVVLRKLTSGLNAIRWTPRGLRGGTDPRREGSVLSR